MTFHSDAVKDSQSQPPSYSHSYSYYFKEILNLAKESGFEIIRYSPYPEYQELQTLLIYNKALLTATKSFIHISGVHGVEGAAGAEVQCQILKKHGKPLVQSNYGFLMVFALNPFGFHFLRRTSIENIDLNRNTGDGLPVISHSRWQTWLRPLWRSHSLWDQLQGALQSLVLGMTQGGLPTLIRWFAEGQSCEPKGVFYSGMEMALEMRELIRRLQPLLQKARSIYLIDVHTGLGKLYGEMLILCHGDAGLAQETFSHSIEIPGDKPKSYRGKGLVSDRFALAFPNVDFFYVVQEFGVKSTAHSFLALLIENQYHWKNFKESGNFDNLYLKHIIKQFFFKTYFYEDKGWLSWLRETGEKRFVELTSNVKV